MWVSLTKHKHFSNNSTIPNCIFLLLDAVNLTLDPNTAHRRLVLSEGNTKATLQGVAQPYPDTPQRFDGWTQVMCQAPLQAQRCYWEVDWRGRGSSMGVAYGSLSRKGLDARSGLGYNAQSWTLELSDTCCSAMHDNQKKDIPVTYSPRLGIYLDLAGGMLGFYSVADNMVPLHTFRANFTQPVYAVFGVGSGVGVGLDFALGQFTSSSDSIKICPLWGCKRCWCWLSFISQIKTHFVRKRPVKRTNTIIRFANRFGSLMKTQHWDIYLVSYILFMKKATS